MNDLTGGRMITEAQAEKIKAEAEMLRNSHVRVDATNLPDTHLHYMQAYVPPPAINNVNVNTTATTTVDQ
jgi:hypothetical protein